MKTKKIFLLVFLFCATSRADLYDLPKVVPVQSRQHYLRNELTLQIGYLPLDPFTKYLAGGFSYTKHFSDFTGWEVVNANYALDFSAGLKRDLQENFNIENDFQVMQYFASTNLVFTPIYTKNLLFNSSVVHSMASFVAGPGLASFNDGIKTCVDVGIILRYFISPSSSIKLDFRDYIFLSAETKNNINMSLGWSYTFGAGNSVDETEF